MKLSIHTIALNIGFLFLCSVSAFAVDMNIFGMKLGAKFSLLECQRINATSTVYKYNNDNPCFARFPSYDNGGNTFLADAPIFNDTVMMKFPVLQKPDMTAGDDVRLIIIDGNLEGSFFYTGGVKLQDFVLSELKEKYGQPTALLPKKVQNGLGATFEAIIAGWTSEDLIVFFDSVGEGLNKGFVRIETRKSKEAEEKRISDLNKAKRKL